MNIRSRRRPQLAFNQPGTSALDSQYLRRHKADHSLLILTALLMVIGLVVVYSISPGLAASQGISQNHFIVKQLIDVSLGVIAFIVATQLPIEKVFKLAKPLAAIAIIGSLVVMFTPINEAYPAHRWIRFGGFSFQVVELIKFALIIWLAGWLAKRYRAGKVNDFKATLRPLLLIVLAAGFVIAKLQSDFGSAAVVVMIIGLMAYAVGVPLRRIAIVAAVVIALAGLAIASTPYRRDRITTFLNPEANCQLSGYHACQALTAIGSGGVFGQGLGFGTASFGYVPEPSNDSIFAVIAEKFGFIGTTIILVIYGLYISRLKKIIARSTNWAYRLIVVGVLAWFSTQMIINIGAMVGLLPLKGITLPLISQGGTSLVFLTAALGLVFQISRYTSYNVKEPEPTGGSFETKNNNLGGRRLGRAYHTAVTARPRT
ncbi:MAG: bacterial cell division membrane protein [Candidatus Saccharibacteria bacterium GW2011_GWA2_46_10]|nr:MAG: bacterial cell division membrane protein [Candidatus Saccharibacteria bacterium GW2011_GWA2_46_10]OGL34967.1 MAG: hypothetical protein A3F05_00175 [Candidatus Saccharibacteria bacterium RIFCSPHIGHO2_12_FULL_47_17]